MTCGEVLAVLLDDSGPGVVGLDDLDGGMSCLEALLEVRAGAEASDQEDGL